MRLLHSWALKSKVLLFLGCAQLRLVVLVLGRCRQICVQVQKINVFKAGMTHCKQACTKIPFKIHRGFIQSSFTIHPRCIKSIQNQFKIHTKSIKSLQNTSKMHSKSMQYQFTINSKTILIRSNKLKSIRDQYTIYSSSMQDTFKAHSKSMQRPLNIH